MEHDKTPAEIEKEKQDKQVMKEMLPYFVYMAIPLIITLTIAMLFAPRMTLP